MIENYKLFIIKNFIKAISEHENLINLHLYSLARHIEAPHLIAVLLVCGFKGLKYHFN